MSTNHCPVGDSSCLQTPEFVVAEIMRVAETMSSIRLHREGGQLAGIFLATDATPTELARLEQHLSAEGISKSVVRYSAEACGYPFCDVQVGRGISSSLVEQSVCATANVLLLNKWSTFSHLIRFWSGKDRDGSETETLFFGDS